MVDEESNTRSFATLVHGGEVRDAVAGIMGQDPVGIERTQNLLLQFNELEGCLQDCPVGHFKFPRPLAGSNSSRQDIRIVG